MTPAQQFKLAHMRGMAASPFTTSPADPLIYIRGTTRTIITGCYIKHKCSSAPLEETGIRPGHTLDVQIPKSLVPVKPDHALDALEYQGRRYTFEPVSGDEPHSPVWVIHATSPIK